MSLDILHPSADQSLSTDRDGLARLGSGYVLVVGIGLFFLLMGIAMHIYEGGTVLDPKGGAFRFWQNFLSDLGRAQTFDGRSNQHVRPYFIAGVLLSTATLGLFMINLCRHLQLHEKTRLRRIFVVSTALTCLGRFGVGLTPWDLLPIPHLICVQITFFSGMALGFLLLRESLPVASFLHSLHRSICLWVVLQLIYVLMLVFGPFLHIETRLALFAAAGAQKILLLCEFWVLVNLCYSLERRKILAQAKK